MRLRVTHRRRRSGTAALGAALTLLGAAPVFAGQVSPVLECVVDNGDGSLTAHWGYNNTSGLVQVLPVGGSPANQFSPSPQDRGQPTTFAIGRHVDVFATVFAPPTLLVWSLGTSTATASAASRRCATPTATATLPAATETATASATATPDDTATATASATAMPDDTATATPAATDTTTPPASATAADTDTPTPTPTPAATAADTPVALCPATPRSGCRTPVGFRRKLVVNARKFLVNWKWRTIGNLDLAEFGDPEQTTSVALCIYAGAVPARVMELAAPAGGTCGGNPCWTTIVGKRLRYRDQEATPSGVVRMVLGRSSETLADISLRARGTNVPLPAMPLAEPVLAQLIRSDGPECWETTYSAPADVNDGELFVARND
jgi:hypothetical protein